jgi:hypothetical protein
MADEKKDEKAPAAPAPGQSSVAGQVSPTVVGGTQVLSGPVPEGGGVAPQAPPGQMVVSGVPGGPFNIRGARFDQIGTVTFAGRIVSVTKWENNVIKGVLPADVPSGEVVVTDGTGKQQKAQWNGGVQA